MAGGAFPEIFHHGAGTAFHGQDTGHFGGWRPSVLSNHSVCLLVLHRSVWAFSIPQGNPAMTSQASAPPTPIAIIPRPPAFTVWLSVPIIIPPGKHNFEHYLVDDTCAGFPETDAVFIGNRRKKSYASLLSYVRRGQGQPLLLILASIRWSQCTVLGTATLSRPDCMNCSRPSARWHPAWQHGQAQNQHKKRHAGMFPLLFPARDGHKFFGQGQWFTGYWTGSLNPGGVFVYLPDHLNVECHNMILLMWNR